MNEWLVSRDLSYMCDMHEWAIDYMSIMVHVWLNYIVFSFLDGEHDLCIGPIDVTTFEIT